MAILKHRLRKRNDDGTYSTIHLETSASLVIMSDGSNAETAIKSKSIKYAAVKLTVAGWDLSTRRQTVAAPGVLPGDTSQLLLLCTKRDTDLSTFADSVIGIAAHDTNSITCVCSIIPPIDLDLYVVMIPLVQP